ncbi:MAG: hypothetical protein DCF29_03790 [Alphaproteobacteria bacterium]|nr:MAG: hypothetical protein DCF29_03790 [Alphaproteobacteria bacterium]
MTTLPSPATAEIGPARPINDPDRITGHVAREVRITLLEPVRATFVVEIEVRPDASDAACRNEAFQLLAGQIERLQDTVRIFWVDADEEEVEWRWRGKTFDQGVLPRLAGRG